MIPYFMIITLKKTSPLTLLLLPPPSSSSCFSDPSCELCGFYFENRKALASHARAHLRQFGVTEWCVNGSPIETLSAWMRSRPQKVLEMHRSYMQGNRSTLKKVRGSGVVGGRSFQSDSSGVNRVSSQALAECIFSFWHFSQVYCCKCECKISVEELVPPTKPSSCIIEEHNPLCYFSDTFTFLSVSLNRRHAWRSNMPQLVARQTFCVLESFRRVVCCQLWAVL